MERFYELFREGASARGVSDDVAKVVFEKIVAFAEFGFPKSHSAAFAFLAFQSAWLRRYYPVEFLCALLNAQPMGFYPPHVLVHDAKRHGVTVLPPDINASAANCSVEHDALRVGFGYVRGIGAGPAQAIAGERARNGAFVSLADFVRRMAVARPMSAEQACTSRWMEDGSPGMTEAGGWRLEAGSAESDLQDPTSLHAVGNIQHRAHRSLNSPAKSAAVSEEAIENLIQTGAFDAFGLNRRELLWQLGLLYRPPNMQLTLPLPIDQDSVRLGDMTTWERMAADYNLLSLSPGHHPMALMRPAIGESMPSLRHLLSMPDGAHVRVPGMVVCRQQPGTAKGFVFLLMEDEFGMLNIIVPPWLHERQRALVRGEPFVIVEGTLQRKEGTVNLLAQRFERLPVPEARRAAERLHEPASHNFG
jgi:error-prone DNA polymerase